MRQLPPIYDSLVTDNSHVDGRLKCAPSHWKKYFKIYYMTEKMRSTEDPYFSMVCDRIGTNELTDEDVLPSDAPTHLVTLNTAPLRTSCLSPDSQWFAFLTEDSLKGISN